MKNTLKRWKSVSSLVDFHNYFTKQWIMSDFNNLSHSLREVVVSDDVVISKPKRGRPRKSGRALEVDDVVESVSDVTNKKKLKVKRLVHFQPRFF